LSHRKIIISRHVIFDETQFPFSRLSSTPLPDYNCFTDDLHPQIIHHWTNPTLQPLSSNLPSPPPDPPSLFPIGSHNISPTNTSTSSSPSSEPPGVANVVSESCWLRNLLLELHFPLSQATLVYCDNVSAIYLSGNPVQHQRTKHIEMDIHFVREKVARGQARVLHVPSRRQIADIFTKGLPRVLFDDFRTSLSVREPPALTAGV
jgi:hypothetical protein